MFLEKMLNWMPGLCISREKRLVGWRGRVFLEKTGSLDGGGAYFSKTTLGCSRSICIKLGSG